MQHNPQQTQPGTPSSTAKDSSQHRLLYRGALSVPDSYLLLDGLSFVAETRNLPQGSPSVTLLSNPLALALESMRGRPSLHLLGTERLEDVWLDPKTSVSVYIHQYSTLSRLYFQNILCVDPITSEQKRTRIGVRVSLTDDGDTDASDFLIYGQLVPATDPFDEVVPSTSGTDPLTLQMYAARILTAPPPRPTRVPRPDDPTPRKPSAYVLDGGNKRKREVSIASSQLSDKIKRTKSGRVLNEEDEQVKNAREVMLRGPQGGHGSRPSRGKSTQDVFKVPPVPVRSGSLSMGESASQSPVDVFGSVSTVKSNGKEPELPGSSELEKANKIVVKQATVTCLASHGVRKGDKEFHELYQTIYRGVTFALRAVMRTQAVNVRSVERLLEAHARMYVYGNGDSHIGGVQDGKR